MPGGKNRLKESNTGRVGLGANLFNDVNGKVSRMGVQFSYAYHIIMYQSQLSFGLSGQFYQYRIGDSLTYGQAGDPLFASGISRVAFIPDADAGVFWTGERFHLGFAADQLFQSVLKLGSGDLSELKIRRHYFLMGGYRFIHEYSGFELEPSFLLKTTEQIIPQLDLSLKIYYKTDYWMGFSYRTGEIVSAMFGIKANKMTIAYAYDYSLSSIRKYSFGSHELFLSLKFGSGERRYRWLNRY